MRLEPPSQPSRPDPSVDPARTEAFSSTPRPPDPVPLPYAPLGRAEPAAPAATPKIPSAEAAPATSRGRGRRLLSAALGALLLLAIAGGLAFAFDRFRDGDDGDGGAAGVAATATAIRGTEEAELAALRATPTPAPTVPPTVAPTATPPPPTPTPKPTTAPTPTRRATGSGAGAAGTRAPTPDDAPAPPPDSLEALLPTEEQVPEGLTQTREGERTEEEVAGALGTDDAAQRLEEWEWEGNAFREFDLPADADAEPDQTNHVDVSVHRFGGAEAAEEALPYFSDLVVDAQGLEEVDVDPLGDQVRALSGAPDGANLVILYIRSGTDLIRIGTASPEGDPTADAVAVAEAILDR